MGDELASEEQLYMAVGRFSIFWARLEMSLDLFLLSSRSRLSGPEHWLNPQLSSKIQIAKEILPALPGPSAQQLGPIIDRIAEYSATRHSLVHGSAYGLETGELRFATLLQSRKKPRRPVHKTTIEAIDELAEKIWDLEGDLLQALSLL